MIKTLRVFSFVVLSLTLLSLYSYAVVLSVDDKQKLGVFAEPLTYFARFPELAYEVLTSKEIQNIPPTYIEGDYTFKQVNNLNYDLFGLNSFYDIKRDEWEIRLFNFRNDSTLFSWHLSHKQFNPEGTDKLFPNSEPRNPILLPDTSIITASDESMNLYRLDRNSNIMWHNTERWFHHSLNLDAEGNIWAGTTSLGTVNHFRQTHVHELLNDYITQVDAKTGEIIFEKRVAEILIENGYPNFVYGFGNIIVSRYSKDPLHLNDIQPALTDSEYWKKGDLFISLRHRSLVFLYRPSTNEIIQLFFGPFLNQHDVDIISDHEIAIFNNNITTVGEFVPDMEYPEDMVVDSLGSSEIVIYDFRDSTYHTHLKDQFLKERIYTYTEGEFEMLSSGDTYVESQNDGKVYILNSAGVVLSKSFPAGLEGMVEQPHWVRIYEKGQLPWQR